MTKDPGSRKADLSPERLALAVLQMKKKKLADAQAGHKAGRPAGAAGPTGIPRRASSGPAPVSFAQQRLWLLDRLEPGSTAYNMPSLSRLRGSLDIAALERATAEIVRRHDSLRTTFAVQEGEPVQVVAPPSAVRLPVVDLSGLTEGLRQAAGRRFPNEALRPFDLERGPLFRAILARLSPSEHLLLTDIHHIVSDGWSFGAYLRELSTLYGAFRDGAAPTLPELPVQYADFASWQRQWLQGAVLEEQLAYWRSRLADAPPALELPLDRIRPAVQTHRGGIVEAGLPAELEARLRELSLREGSSLFMTLLAAFQLLLSRLSGQDDVVVGSPSAGRGQVETEGLIGLFLNTMVLRTDLSGEPTFRELLGRVKEVVLGAHGYQAIPFERLLEELQPERHLSRTPIFQVLFNFVSVSGLQLALPGLEVEEIDLQAVESKFDFTLYVNEMAGSLRFGLVYNADLFEPERMAEMLRQLEHLLAQAVATPDRRIGDLSLVTSAAAALLPDPAQSLGDEWHGAVHQALSRQAGRHPDRIAVSDTQGAAWTYAELESRVNRLARFLVANGVKKGGVVAVWAHRSALLVQALLGTLKAGAAFMVLDPAYPAPRLLDYLRISRPVAWVAVPGAPPPPTEVEEALASTTALCRVDLPALTGPDTHPDVPVGPDDAACITFTSGSTGMPKGVIGRHGPLTHFYPWMGEHFELGGDDRFGMLSALSHDPLQRDVFTPVWFGAQLVVPDPDRIGAPGYLAEWLRRERVTVLHLTPAMMEMVLDSADNGVERISDLPDLRRVFVVGDLLKKGDVEHLRGLAPSVDCINLYGSTETQRSVSYFPVPRSGRPGKEVLPLGRGMKGVQLLVLNRMGRLAGVGEAGEIHLRSRHLARGYLGDEALTAERFRSNPLVPSPEEGDRVYRTGDLGRYLPDGNVEFAGRSDFQVKLRGFRIELGEVEAALARFPGVRECAVIVREDRPGDRRLVAYLVSADVAGAAAPSSRDLRMFLASRLPDYMVPSAFMALPALPLTRTGKMDRRALPAPAEERPETERPGERSPVEELLAGIWADLLGVPDIASHGSFFELGGHSLLAMRMISRVRTVLDVELPMRAVFEEPTLAGFATLAERVRLGAAEGGAVPPLVRVPRGEPLPTSFAQQRLWFMDQLEPGSFAYNLAGAVRLEGLPDLAALAGALSGIVHRHESLRTRFVEEDGEPRQVIAEPAPLSLPVVDLSSLAAEAREAEVRRVARTEARRPYNLSRGPLVRSILLRLGEREHALLSGMHHIVSDGWSMGIFVRELGALYRSLATGESATLPELPIQYADYAAWQRQWLSGDAMEDRLAWWKGQLAGAPQVVDLPLDRPRPAVQSYRGGRVALVIDRELEARLEAVTRRLGVTPFMALLAGFATLLARYGSQSDIVVGIPIANRGRAELEELIGFFANTLALRVDLSGDPAFDELARRVREVALGAYAHQDVPFERLVSELRPERDLSHAPVFQVMLALQNLPESRLDLADLTLSPLELDFGRTQFDLSLSLFPQPREGGLLARLEHARDLFDPGTAERLLAHARNLLAGIAQAPERRLSELPLLAPEERQQLLDVGNRTAAEVPGRLLHQLFEARAVELPDAVAVAHEGEALTYAELNASANRLAHRLRRLGVGPETLVVICLERSPAMLAALLGVLKAGGAYVPLDPTYPAERLAWVLEDSRAPVLVTQDLLVDVLPDYNGQTIVLDQIDLSDESPSDPAPLAGPESLAYVLYTSGSTGRPKGVAVRQRGAVNFLASMAHRPGLDPDDVLLAVTTIAFDISVLELFLPLSRGARIELVDRETSVDGFRLMETIARSGATVMQATPATWRLLLEAGWEASPGLKVLCGGEAMPPDLALELLARTREVWNVYGPTETTVWSAVHRVAAADASGTKAMPLGDAVANTEIYLLDRFEHGAEPVPLGSPGELYIGGEGIARGYLDRPELTAERFVPDPFSGRPGARLYRTGDLVRRRSWDGALEFLGRVDHQVKIRGFRIELGEIESVLSSHPSVSECAVVAREDLPGFKRVVAYLATHDDGQIDLEALRGVLRQKLPEYMVPQLFVTLPSLPLTPNGKVDRQALPAPSEERSETERPLEKRPFEELLASIWADLLGVPDVAPQGSFFELGGHSLLATRMISRVRTVLGMELPIRAVFEEPTLAGFAALAERVWRGEVESAAVPPLVRVPRSEPLPASFAQQRLWFLDQLEPGSFAYNLAGAVRLEGSLDIAAMAEALSGIVRRHESLRTRFVEEDGEPRQVIAESAPLSLTLLDLSGLSAEIREAEMRRVARAEARRPYDLSRGPLVRSSLLRLAEREHALLVGMHHVVSDGWSMGIFVRELGALYRALATGERAALPDLPIQYADYATWQRQWLSGETMEDRLAWWTRQLAGAPEVLDLPLDHPRPAVQSYRGGRVSLAIDRELESRLNASARRLGVTPFMVLLAGFATQMSRYGGQTDVVVGSPIANRGRAELEELIGFFVNTLALRVDLSGNPGFDELARRVREVALGAYAHQDVPFERLVSELRPERDLSHAPVFQALLALQNLPESHLDLVGMALSPLDLDPGRTQFDLSLFLFPLPGGGLTARLEYALDLFDTATAQRVLGHLRTLLEGAVASPKASLSRLPLLTEGEQAQLATWNREERRGHPEGLLHALFETQAGRTPEAVALVAGSTVLTYRELEERSTRLARRLRALGAGPEVGVAVCLERTADLAVSLLAVLRAGSFYVPLDPRYPAERLRLLLEDSGARLVVTLSRLAELLPEDARLLLLDGPEPAVPLVPNAEVTARNLAYLIYTSGSTGRPKAVAVEHRSAAVLMHWAREEFSPDELRGVLASTAITFDLSVFELFVPLSWGGTVVLAENALDLPRVAASLPPDTEITLVNTVPSAMAELLSEGAVPPSVRTINLAGEALPRWLADRAYARPETGRLCNLYGPSEDTTYSTWTVVERSVERTPSIGRPVDDTRAYVLDPWLEHLPVGVPGELYLAGSGLARGYLGRPELTADRFVPDPLSTEDGARMYRTGDLVRRRADGELDYLGRLDHQVKIRGFRIELGEVEAALVRQPGVESAVVLAREDVPGEKRLVAYVVALGSPSELRHALQRDLPEPMVPSAFVFLTELPLTAHGKVDRRALPPPSAERREVDRAVESSPAEELLAGVWARVLGVSSVAPHESFFELGGHSLLATRMISRVRTVLGLELPMRAVFEEPTLAGFAALADRLRRGDGEELTVPALVPVPRNEPLLASFSQQRLWFLDQFEPGSFTYNLVGAVRLEGCLDVVALSGALGAVVRRHESLRTHFAEEGGEPLQVIAEPAPLELPVVSLAGLAGEGREAEARRVAVAEARRPYDLARGPLMRSTLLRLSEREHVLLVGMHHIVSDGWSMGIFVRELGGLYRGWETLSALTIQYADYAAWQRQWLSGQAMEDRLVWWKGQLSGAPKVLDIPLDRPRPAVQSYRGGRVGASIAHELVARLEAVSRRLGVTPFMTLLAGFAALLARYSNQTDLVVGTPIANRGRAELEDLIGFFANTLALRVDLSGDPTFDALAGRIREMALGAYARQDVPFERLVSELQVERDLSHTPVFQVVLALQNLPESHLDLEGLTLSPVELDFDRSQFDLSLFLMPLPEGGLRARLEYVRDLFDEGTVQRLLGHFRRILEGIAAEGSSGRISELQLLAEEEREQVLHQWNDTATLYPRGATVHGLFEEQARRTPDALAVTGGGEEVTYSELDRRATRLAARLLAKGVRLDEAVGLCAERSVDLIAALLGILKAGGAYVPLDPTYPRERLAAMLADAGARILVVQEGLESALPESGAVQLPLRRTLVEEAVLAVLPEAHPEQLAYILFTSGSTGRPKGVAVTHRSVVRLVRETGFAHFGPEEVFLQFGPVSFDASTLEIWGPLLNGGRLVLFPPGPPDLRQLGDALERHGVTTLFLTSGLFHQMVELHLESLRGVRQLATGGDVLSPDHVRRALAGLPGQTLIIAYGPTENTTFTSCHTMRSEADLGPGSVPLGRPIANTQVYILDAAFHPVPVGVVGQLYTGGDGLARGYVGRPDLTAERFVPDPVSGEPGARLYATGDLARWRPSSGVIEFQGRADAQVKIRGFRIEPGEIEAVLVEYPGVEASVVIPREDLPGDRRLAAYVVPADDNSPDPVALRAWVEARLPAYMVPSVFVLLPELPLGPTGKIDRRTLPAPSWERREADRVVERRPVEELLAGVWGDLLGVPDVAPQESFFELGGHSLLATRMISRVRAVLGVELPIRALFEQPTLVGFAALVDGARLGDEGAVQPPLVPVPRSGPLPASFSQQRLWFLDQLESGSFAYNLGGAVRLEGSLKFAALAGTLAAIVRRHESLRTRFIEQDGQPWQVIAELAPISLPIVDLSGLAAPARKTEASRLMGAEARRPYNLSRGPLVRSILLRLDEREHALLAGMHHIVSDGWSMGIFVRELGAFYRALATGETADLPELSVQYADYAVWQREWLSGQVMEEWLSWWLRQLSGAPQVVELPLDRPRPAVQSHRGGRVNLTIGRDLVMRLDALSRRLGVTPFMALLAGYATLLSRYGSQTDVVVGTPIANRNRAEVEDLIGFFANTLALRVDLSGNPGFDELSGRVRNLALGAYARQDVPFERLVGELQLDRDLSHAPVFQVMLALQNLPQSNLDLAGLKLSPLTLDFGGTQFDLSLSLASLPEGGLLARLDYVRDLFDATTAERVLGHFQTLLEGAVTSPEAPLLRLPLLTESERMQFADWDLVRRRNHPAGLLHALFEAQAERTPDAVALVAGDVVLTYRELDNRSARLASRLRALGGGPEVGVAVCLERTADLVVSLMAVLRSGSFYVPLDPRYPEERLRLLVEDSGARLVVTLSRLAERLPDQVRLLLLDEPEPEPTVSVAPAAEVTSRNLAYLIYTSGSTGRPKAVAIEHRSATVLAHWAREEFSAEELRGVLASTAITFDLSVFELFVTLSWGGTVLLAENALELRQVAATLPSGVEITLVNTVPSAMAELLNQDALPSSVRTINLAGEALPRWLADRAYARSETVRLCNLYGPSEDTTYSTWTLVERSSERGPSIGCPVADTRAYVLDPQLERLPLGVPGELYLAGAGLARGYLGRPDLTAGRFVPDPFSAEAGGRMYRTGDLVRVRIDGELDYLGRLDHQVKVRGFRIELGEVEAALVRQPGIESAVVLAREDLPGDKRLVAYVVAPSGEISVEQLRRGLQRILPDPMMPSAFVLLPELPLGPTGKVDRHALPAPAAERREVDRALERSPVEELLAGVWGDLLSVPDVAPQESFFELGGHSLLATRMISRVRAVLGVELPIRSIFGEPTLSGFATLVDQIRKGDAEGAVQPPLVPVPRSGSLPTSFSQQRLWFLDQLEPGSFVYNLSGAVRLEGLLDVAALAGTLRAIVARHESLRTRFIKEDGQPRQVIAEPAPMPLPVIDLSDLAAEAREAEARRVVGIEARRPYDLSRGPLVRSVLLRLDEREHALLVGMHHIVSDGWSMGIFVRELGVLYRALGTGEMPMLPELSIQYADFASWQRQWLSGQVMEERLAWWMWQLSGAPQVADLPLDRPRPAVQSYRGGRVGMSIGRELVGRLEETSRRLGVTPFMALLAGFTTLLSRYGSQTDIVLGTPIANRGRAELEDLIGFFANTLALRVDLSGDPTFDELAGRVREVALGAYARQDIPFERLVNELQLERDLSHTPVFQVVLALQNLPESRLDLAGLTLSPLEFDFGRTQYDLSLSLVPLPEGGLQARLDYVRDLFDTGTVQRLLGHFHRLLESVVEGSSGRISGLSLLADEEREQVLNEWNHTAAEIPEKPVHQLFREWAERAPDTLAVAWNGGRLTYGELAAQAEALALRLRRQGVGPETVVALCFERSSELITAALAVLEAGGAYLPVDPAQPAERQDWILRDSGAALALTSTDLLTVQQGERFVPADAGADGLAYVIYTSGSTGMPKGTELAHRGLSSLVAWHRRTYGIGPADRTTLLAGPGFDASVWETWAALTTGASLHIPAREVVLSPPALLRWMGEEGITVSFLPTPLAEAVLSEPIPKGLSLRLLLTGGDRLVRRPAPTLPYALVNHYGPTESTVVATAGQVASTGERAPEIGSPIANTRVYILDRLLRPVPVGIAGELCLAGDGLARGYRKRPELTAERFVPDPFGKDGARLYRTGDVARWRPDGEIEFLGRVDSQVKVRGFRIELGEVESALSRQPGVESAVVLAREDARGNNRLVAYMVASNGAISIEELRRGLQRALPESMVPSAFVLLSELPRNPAGKVDRRALPTPESLRQESDPDFVLPRTPLEEQVARVWREVLGVDRIGVQDSFWALGGHSLLATRVLARTEELFRVDLPLQTLFASPTLEGFAALVGESVLAAEEGEELTAALAELSDLSEEEIRALIEREARDFEEMV